jgi:hypothetical protein
MNFSANGNKTHAGCTKGITPFATPWRSFEEMNDDAAEESYFEASTVKSFADIRKHVAGAKVEPPTTFMGLIRVLNNYSRLLEVLFGAECDHLAQILAIRGGLEDHETDLETRLTPALILHLLWRQVRHLISLFLGWPHAQNRAPANQKTNQCMNYRQLQGRVHGRTNSAQSWWSMMGTGTHTGTNSCQRARLFAVGRLWGSILVPTGATRVSSSPHC